MLYGCSALGSHVGVGVGVDVGVGVGGGQLPSIQTLDIVILTNSGFELGSLPQTYNIVEGLITP